MDTPTPLITLQDVSRTFAMRDAPPVRALRAITLEIRAGEFVAVLGKSGSGKSTLLNLVAGLDHADSGHVGVAGRELARLGEDALAGWRGTHVGVVFQFFQLLPTLTVAENLVLAMELVGAVAPAERMPRALALLERVGLADQARKLPSMLSGGQQQRAAVARALANDPPIVLADEPTGNLDSETAAGLADLFAELASRGKTLVIATHDASLAAAAHRVVSLRDGAVAGDQAQVPA